ncbi:MAG: hypothetical protein WC378_00325 [Opitutaceae bacterium]|jgi:hypothetical protein
MGSTITWRGDAAAVAQVDLVTIGGTVAADDVFTFTIGSKTLSVVSGGATNVIAAAACVAAWNALTSAIAPEFAEITAADNEDGTFTLTADVPGKPFTCTVASIPDDDETIELTPDTVSSGPNDASTLANYSGGVLPVDTDTLVFENNASSVLYGLDALDAVTLAALIIKQSYTGYIGLPQTNGSGSSAYHEYRDQYLQVGATLLRIGEGDGVGSGRIKIDVGSVQTAAQIVNAGSQAESYIPAVLLKGSHASNTVTVLKGAVGIAFFTGETSVVATLTIGYLTSVLGDANVTVGSGATLTTILKAGGKLSFASNVTTFTQYDGETTVGGSATVGTGTVGGTLIDQSTGTFTTLVMLAKAVYDHAKSLAAKTITNFTMNAGASYKDPYGVVTLSNGIVLNACKPADVTIDIAAGHTLDISA